ncbi:pilus assembly FimT family protein [Roseofilum casamattae]|uniref:Type II secretion system protein n=1 Tax=Roseofilum casamattae BLCC-M143 TaxID=3022442 RepID=A0ABT7C1N6_9CYAN|nr:type II secretion system protein [Roseofilum casamattae]MDJ1184987.1 type II secretion system protein [Roseofilum casamattae BLCC-M143]
MRLWWMGWLKLRQSEVEGFTLIEVLVAIVIVGILSAMATPTWLGFVRQQRVSAINEDISLALRNAQQKARSTKIAQAVSVRINDSGLAQVAIHEKGADITEINKLDEPTWTNLGNDKGVSGTDVLLFSNLVPNLSSSKNINTLDKSVSSDTYPQPISKDDKGPVTIVFNQFGSLDGDDVAALEFGVRGLVIGVGVPAGSSATKPVKDSERCIKVKTLLGAMELGIGEEECKPWQ